MQVLDIAEGDMIKRVVGSPGAYRSGGGGKFGWRLPGVTLEQPVEGTDAFKTHRAAGPDYGMVVPKHFLRHANPSDRNVLMGCHPISLFEQAQEMKFRKAGMAGHFVYVDYSPVMAVDKCLGGDDSPI